MVRHICGFPVFLNTVEVVKASLSRSVVESACNANEVLVKFRVFFARRSSLVISKMGTTPIQGTILITLLTGRQKKDMSL